MAVDKPGDRLIFNTRERLLSTDLNSLQKILRWDFTSMFGHLHTNLFGPGSDDEWGRVLRGLSVVATSPASNQITVNIGAALIFGSDIDGGVVGDVSWNGWSIVPVYAPVNLTVAANSSGNGRIDIVLMKVVRENAELETKDIFNTITRLFVPTLSTPKRRRTAADATNGNVYIKQGTPAGSPVPPSIDSNTIELARIVVDDGFTTIVTADITDKRRPMRLPRWRGRILGSSGAIQWFDSENGGSIVFSANATGVFTFTHSGFAETTASPPFASIKITPHMTSGEDPLSYYVKASETDELVIQFYGWNEVAGEWQLWDPLSFDLEVESYSAIYDETDFNVSGSGL